MLKSKINLSSGSKNNAVTYIILLAVFAVALIWQSTGEMPRKVSNLLVPLCLYSIVAVALNLVVGILGDLSLGHAGFMCIGAYSSAIFTNTFVDLIENEALRFFLAFIVGGIFAAIFGFLICIPVLRLKGDYLAIVTLAFGEIIKNIIDIVYLGVDKTGYKFALTNNDCIEKMGEDGKMIIKGAMGISGTPTSSNFVIAFIVLFIVVVASLNLINSRTGRAVMAIRDNKIAAESIGINITKYKLIVFTISAFFAGLAGVLYSHNLNSFSTGAFDYNASILILVYVVLGGIGSIRGSIIATIILYALPELLREVGEYRMLIYAILLVVMMIVNNNEKFKNITKSLKLKKQPKEVKTDGTA